MKKITKIFASLVAVCALCAVFALTGCGKQPGQNNGGKGDVVALQNGVLFVATKDVMEIAETTTLKEYMDIMVENGGISYNENGGFVTSVNDVVPDASKNEFLAIYTSSTEWSNNEWGTYEYNGKTYASATKGIVELPCIEGETYIFVISTY